MKQLEIENLSLPGSVLYFWQYRKGRNVMRCIGVPASQVVFTTSSTPTSVLENANFASAGVGPDLNGLWHSYFRAQNQQRCLDTFRQGICGLHTYIPPADYGLHLS